MFVVEHERERRKKKALVFPRISLSYFHQEHGLVSLSTVESAPRDDCSRTLANAERRDRSWRTRTTRGENPTRPAFLNSRPATISSSHCFSLASRRNIMVFVIRSTKNSRNLRFDDPHATFPSINRTEKDSSKLVAISLDEKKSNKSKN